ncbi:4-amino-4-deoxy-L-arabinose transferase [Verrucomicrobium sp. GAS474]|uniref:hypothetical protein n=1 Tax=Verrucomicrobium sp. GAS474 TaxID=1882831 RepID=UPI00087DAECF|nr:hypothetical protein [Verrucomicrobium sp. GAS474]SDU25279.1 4-amino-4-deoxy-L-arabinose transferase [Verrucomicrobium sp. GAS474]
MFSSPALFPLLSQGTGLALVAGMAMLAWSSFLPKARRPAWDRPWLFALGLFLAVYALRVPTILFPLPFNTDEDVFLAEAITYRDLHGIVPWRDVDSYSGGPLIALQLLWTAPFGLPLSFITERITAIFDEGLFLLFFWLAVRRLFGEPLARLSVFPFFLFFALAIHIEWIHYSSEHLSLPLFGAALWLLARIWKGTAVGWLRFDLAALGGVLALQPFVKLQGAPEALFLGLTGLGLAVRKPGGWKAAGFLVGGAGVPLALFFAFLQSQGAVGDFWNAYIVWAVEYSKGVGLLQRGDVALEFLFNPKTAVHVLSMMLSFLLLCLVFPAWRRRQGRWILSWALGFFLVAVVAVTTSGKGTFHYILYLLPALAVLMTIGARQALFAGRRGWSIPGALLAGLIVWGGIVVFYYAPRGTGGSRVMAWPAAAVCVAVLLVLFALARAQVGKRWGWVGIALFVVVLVEIPHFHHFSALGIFLLMALLWGQAERFPRLAPFLLCAAVPLLFLAKYTKGYGRTLLVTRCPVDSPMARAVQAEARPGDRIAIWGWSPELAVFAGLPLGTREPSTDMAIGGGPRQAFYQARFLHDLARNRPRLFVEAVGPGSYLFHDRATEGIDRFPEVGRYVNEHYALRTEADGMRLFVLKEGR